MFHPDEQQDAEEPESEEGMEDEVQDDVGPGAGEGERGQEVEGQGEGGEGTDWAKINRQRKYKAGLFVCLADLQQRLVLTAVALEPGMAMLHEAFRLADSEFEIQQQRKVVAGEERTYRVLETARATLVNKCFQEVSLRIQTVEPSTAKTMLHFEFKVFSVSNDEFFSLQCPCNIEKVSPWFPIPAFSDSGWESWGPCCLLSQTMLLGRIGSDFFHKVPHLGERHFRSCPCILAMLGAHGGNRFSSRVYCAELFPKVWKPCAYSCVNSGPVITTIVPLSILYLSIQCLHKINY